MEVAAISVKNELGTDFLHIEYNETDKWVYAYWVGDVTVEDLKEGSEKILAQLQLHSCPNILNNTQELKGAFGEVAEWIQQSWMPRAVDAGLQKFANILSSDVFSAMSAEEIGDKVNGYEIGNFEDIEEAKAWLKS